MNPATLPWLPKPPENFRQLCATLPNLAENPGPALLRAAACALDNNQLHSLARAYAKILTKHPDSLGLTPIRLGILSNATVDLLLPAIIASGLRYGLAVEVIVPPFGQVMQAVTDPDSGLWSGRLDVVLLMLDHRGHGLHDMPSLDRAIATLAQLREGIAGKGGIPTIIQTVPRPPELLLGSFDFVSPNSIRGAIHDFNSHLRQTIPGSSDIIFDVAALAETVGLAEWHDPVAWHTAKLPFSQRFVPLYADALARLLGAVRGKSRKCLVLDLDNTLWGGVIGDDGIDGIKLGQGDGLGEAHLSVQRHALALSKRGIILAVCSKNNDQIARQPFQNHPDMVLREEHIAVFQANWVDKATNLRAIAKMLNIGTDALVFLDDNPTERHMVRRELPEVAVPEVPDDPALFPLYLSLAGYFDAVAFSADDEKRSEFYRTQAQRLALQESTSDLEGYLRSLDMTLHISPFDKIGRSRITQLINKSNQFNLTTRRYTEAEIATFENDPDAITLQARLIDCFGDNGMISVIICRILDERWVIDTWLMSCRVLGRRVENAMLDFLSKQLGNRGATEVFGSYIPTKRNGLVQDHYASLGFALLRAEDDGTTHWRLDLTQRRPYNAPIRIVAEAEESSNHN